MNFYEVLISEIETLIAEKNYEEALRKINDELAMPYVPRESLEVLEAYQILCQQALKANAPVKTKDFHQIIDGLFKDDFEAMNSLVLLSQVNLRLYLEEIQEVLDKLENKTILGLFLLQLTQQKIDAEFTVYKNGLEVKFYPVYMESPQESDGFIIASEFFKDQFFKEPQFEKLCQELLIQETLSYLPLSYSDQEGQSLAYAIIKKGFLLSTREQEWYDYQVKNHIEEDQLLELIMDI